MATSSAARSGTETRATPSVIRRRVTCDTVSPVSLARSSNLATRSPGRRTERCRPSPGGVLGPGRSSTSPVCSSSHLTPRGLVISKTTAGSWRESWAPPAGSQSRSSPPLNCHTPSHAPPSPGPPLRSHAQPDPGRAGRPPSGRDPQPSPGDIPLFSSSPPTRWVNEKKVRRDSLLCGPTRSTVTGNTKAAFPTVWASPVIPVRFGSVAPDPGCVSSMRATRRTR